MFRPRVPDIRAVIRAGAAQFNDGSRRRGGFRG
jgi:hypothetical protein